MFPTREYTTLAVQSPRLGSAKSPRLGNLTNAPHTPSTPQLAWRTSPRKQTRMLSVLPALLLCTAALLGLIALAVRQHRAMPTRERLRLAFAPINGALDPIVLPSLFDRGHTFTPVTPKRVVVMQADTRSLSNVTSDVPQEADYWVATTMANALWALRHGYDYQRPVVREWEGWHSTWPRMQAIRDVIPKYDYTIYFDSDAFVAQPELSLDDLRRRWGMHDQASFLASRDRSPDQIIAGFWIFRNTPTTLQMLDDLISCPITMPDCARWKVEAYHEQSVFNKHLKQRYTEGEELIVAPCAEAYGAPDYDLATDCQGTVVRHAGGPGKSQLPGQVADIMLQTAWNLVGSVFNGTHLHL